MTDTVIVECSPVKHHTHGLTASNRSTASLFAEIVAARLGLTAYFVQCSASDQRAGRQGNREYYYSKDVGIAPAVFNPPHDALLTLIDVDFYIDMPEFLTRNFMPTLIYTFCPESVAGQSEGYAFTFDRASYVKYTVSGGAEYRHQLWDYGSDNIAMTRLYWEGCKPFFATSVYLVDRRRIAPHRFLVTLTPVRRWTWIPAYIAQQLESSTLQRLRLAYGAHLRLFIQTKEGLHVSTGNVDQYNTSLTTAAIDSTIAAIARITKIPLSMSQVKGLIGDDTPGAATLTEYHRLQTGDKPAFVYPVDMGVRSYQIVSAYPDMSAKPSLTAFMPPLLPDCFSPSICAGNEEAAVKGRITDIKPSTITPTQFMVRTIHEFARLLIPVEHMLHPETEDYVYLKQCRPTQRSILNLASSGESIKRIVKSFIKREAYSTANTPRVISTINGPDKLAYSAYMYAFSRVIAKQPWYAFSRTPLEVAERVSELLETATFACNTDFSRFDGRVSNFLRDLERILILRAFHSNYHAELLDLLRSQYQLKGYTTFGVKYETGSSRASGSPETSTFNTLCNAYVAFLALRMSKVDGVFIEAPEAFKMLGIYGGDDGLTAEVDPVIYRKAASSVGQQLDCDRIERGEFGIKFLARIYSPDVWWGNKTSCCDLPRQLAKFHATTKLPPNVTPRMKLIEKCRAYFLSDKHTPIIGPLVTKVMAMSENYPTTDYLRIWSLNKEIENQYPNENNGWMEPYAMLSLPAFDIDGFNSWIDSCASINEILAGRSFQEVNDPEVKLRTECDGDIFHPPAPPPPPPVLPTAPAPIINPFTSSPWMDPAWPCHAKPTKGPLRQPMNELFGNMTISEADSDDCDLEGKREEESKEPYFQVDERDLDAYLKDNPEFFDDPECGERIATMASSETNSIFKKVAGPPRQHVKTGKYRVRRSEAVVAKQRDAKPGQHTHGRDNFKRTSRASNFHGSRDSKRASRSSNWRGATTKPGWKVAATATAMLPLTKGQVWAANYSNSEDETKCPEWYYVAAIICAIVIAGVVLNVCLTLGLMSKPVATIWRSAYQFIVGYTVTVLTVPLLNHRVVADFSPPRPQEQFMLFGTMFVVLFVALRKLSNHPNVGHNYYPTYPNLLSVLTDMPANKTSRKAAPTLSKLKVLTTGDFVPKPLTSKQRRMMKTEALGVGLQRAQETLQTLRDQRHYRAKSNVPGKPETYTPEYAKMLRDQNQQLGVPKTTKKQNTQSLLGDVEHYLAGSSDNGDLQRVTEVHPKDPTPIGVAPDSENDRHSYPSITGTKNYIGTYPEPVPADEEGNSALLARAVMAAIAHGGSVNSHMADLAASDFKTYKDGRKRYLDKTYHRNFRRPTHESLPLDIENAPNSSPRKPGPKPKLVKPSTNFNSTLGYPGEGPPKRNRSKRNPPKQRQKRGVKAIVVASRTNFVGAPKQPKIIHHQNGDITVNYREEMLELSGSVAFASQVVEFNPGLASISTILAQNANLYDFYKINYFKLHYVPAKGTNTNGRISFCADYDDRVGEMTSMKQCGAMDDTTRTVPGQKITLELQKRLITARLKRYLVRPEAVPTGSVRADFDNFSLHFCTSDAADTTLFGVIDMEYSITFTGRTMLNSAYGRVYGGEITGNGSISNTAPLGLTPIVDTDSLGISAADASGDSAVTINNPGLYEVTINAIGSSISGITSGLTNGTLSSVHSLVIDGGTTVANITYFVLSTATHNAPSVLTFRFSGTVTGCLVVVGSMPLSSSALARLNALKHNHIEDEKQDEEDTSKQSLTTKLTNDLRERLIIERKIDQKRSRDVQHFIELPSPPPSRGGSWKLI